MLALSINKVKKFYRRLWPHDFYNPISSLVNIIDSNFIDEINNLQKIIFPHKIKIVPMQFPINESRSSVALLFPSLYMAIPL